jgi:hypothetical protein
MNAIQTALSSARFNRLVFWLGIFVLAAGTMALVVKLAGGSDPTSAAPDKGFKAQLPSQIVPLKNSRGVRVKTFWQLDAWMRATIRKFIGTVVMRRHLDQSWNLIAPSMRAGWTKKQWTKSNGTLPVVPYPVDDLDKVNYYLDYASTEAILIEVGVGARPEMKLRSTIFQLELVPVGKGPNKRWLVDYWMPRWTPPVPENHF